MTVFGPVVAALAVSGGVGAFATFVATVAHIHQSERTAARTGTRVWQQA
jgi:hypothetical protein